MKSGFAMIFATLVEHNNRQEQLVNDLVKSADHEENESIACAISNMVGNDENLLVKLMGSFVTSTNTDMTHLCQAVEDERDDEAKARLHRLKGACALVGASVFVKQLERLETFTRISRSDVMSARARLQEIHILLSNNRLFHNS